MKRRAATQKPSRFSSRLFSRGIRRLRAGEEGSAIIETAVCMLTIMTVTFWLFEFCLMLYGFATLNEAAQEGVRYAIAHGSDSSLCSGPSSGCTDTTGSNVVAVVQEATKVSMQTVPASAISVSWPESASTPGSLVKVQISYTFAPFVKYAGLQKLMTVTAQGRIIY